LAAPPHLREILEVDLGVTPLRAEDLRHLSEGKAKTRSKMACLQGEASVEVIGLVAHGWVLGY
jgi:hypothetical protein